MKPSLFLHVIGLALPAMALLPFSVLGQPAVADYVINNMVGPRTLQVGLSGTYRVMATYDGYSDGGSVELFIIFAGKLEQTGQIVASPGLECDVRHDAGINAAVRCTGAVRQQATVTVTVQGRGQEPGKGTLVATLNPSGAQPDRDNSNNTLQFDVTLQ